MGVVQDIQNDLERGAARLVAEYRSRLMRDAVGLCGDAAEAEDFVFRTFDKAIRNIDSFREEGSLYDWMKVILVNDVRSAHRSKVVQNTIVSDMSRESSQIEPSTATEEAVMNDSDDELVREAIARLPESQRDVILLHYFKDWPVAKMAKFLALPETTVKFRLLAGRKALAAIISRQLKRPIVRVALVALLGACAAFAATVAGFAVFDAATPATVSGTVGQPAQPDIFDTTQKGENMIMTRKMASLVGASMLAMVSPGSELTTEPTFVFLRPETSSFWNTATNNVMTVPVDFPSGATSATLLVSGVAHTRRYEGITEKSFTFELPPADSEETENVYDLALEFNNTAHTVRRAKLGLIKGLSPDAEGVTRCLAPANGRIWERVRGRAVLPIPYGASDTISVKRNDGAWTELDTGLNGAQGWCALSVSPGERVSLSMIASGLSYTASLVGPGGMMLIYK